MKRTILITALLMAGFAVSASVSSAASAKDMVYVQSLKANIMSAPSFKAQAVGTAMKGDAMTVLHKKNRWVRVNFRGKDGWVPEMVVGSKPPMKRVSVLTGEEENIGTGARRRASQVTSAAAARGLTDDDRRRVGHKGVVDYGTLEKIEAVSVSEAELAKFQQELK